MVTRPETEDDPLVAMLEERGAVPIRAPVIDLVPAETKVLDEAIEELAHGSFEWILFTSRTGVVVLATRLAELGLGPEAVDASVAAVGDGTAGALKEAGISPRLVPSTFTTDALANEMAAGTGRVLLARADIAGNELEFALRARGWKPTRVNVYRTRFLDRMPREAADALRNGTVDAITFTSASTVDGLRRLLPSWSALPDPRPKIVCIGPVTAVAARHAGLAVDAVASPHTIEGLVSALESIFDREGA